jgi:hypothetical protein
VSTFRIAIALLLFATASLVASVFTTRSGRGADLDTPSTMDAKLIYGGQFRINGQPADMQLLYSSLSVPEVMRLLKASLGGKRLEYRITARTAIGKIVEGEMEKRFLITSPGSSRSSLIFILRGNPEAFVRKDSGIPWPSTLPELDPLQSPQLVVEHTDNHFTFACVTIPGNQPEAVLQNCRERLQSDGWEMIPSTENALNRMLVDRFAVFGNRTRVCWLEVRPDSQANQMVATMVCRSQ